MEPVPIPTATHEGRLQIGEVKIPCFVLPDGQRVITKAGICQALGCTAEELDGICDRLGWPRFRTGPDEEGADA